MRMYNIDRLFLNDNLVMTYNFRNLNLTFYHYI